MRAFSISLFLWAIAATALAQTKGGDELSGPYDVVAGWPADICGDGWQMGSVGGVWAQNSNRVFVLQRGCLPELEPTRSIVPSRNASQYSFAAEDPERHPRPGLHLVIFNREGELVATFPSTTVPFSKPMLAAVEKALQ